MPDSNEMIVFKINAQLTAYESSTTLDEIQKMLMHLAADFVCLEVGGELGPAGNRLHAWMRELTDKIEANGFDIAKAVHGMRRSVLDRTPPDDDENFLDVTDGGADPDDEDDMECGEALMNISKLDTESFNGHELIQDKWREIYDEKKCDGTEELFIFEQ